MPTDIRTNTRHQQWRRWLATATLAACVRTILLAPFCFRFAQKYLHQILKNESYIFIRVGVAEVEEESPVYVWLCADGLYGYVVHVCVCASVPDSAKKCADASLKSLLIKFKTIPQFGRHRRCCCRRC